MSTGKVCLIGLDCASPELVFERWRSDLPNLDRLMREGIWGPLESTIPPITVPAWMCMMTGRDPGTLGIYGFRNRKDRSYEGLSFANSRQVKHPAVWNVLGKHNHKSIVIGVPLTYPPPPIDGVLVSDFMAPGIECEYTYPATLKDEIREVVGEYVFDVRDFRTNDKDRLLAAVYEMTEKRFRLARHLLSNHPWDFFAMVEMGTDRMHHGFWRYMDPAHRYHEPDSPYQDAIRDYYVAVDRYIGELIEELPEGTDIIVASDHGAKRMDGAVCLNEWLIREGYLVLKETLHSVTKFSPALVDWDKSSVWGDGGYYGRIFLNVEGREPKGIVPAGAIEGLRNEIAEKLEALTDELGRPLGNRVFRPEEIYAATEGIPPDLIVYFGDLHWRSVGSIGHESVWVHENDTGPDDANHAQHGIAILARKDETVADSGGRREGMTIYDIAPTILRSFGISPPPGMGRTAIEQVEMNDGSVYSPEEEAEIARRLEELGYL
jgi:predicted AlkP superfamily phosphohydrolase/phosphomutase